MTVYVDTMKASYGRMTMCHMIADSDDELRAMARLIGVQEKWHQGDHFDICLAKKKLAITHGAVEITQKQLGAMTIRMRKTGRLGDPNDAVDWFKAQLQLYRDSR